eukprot:7229484-Pyramimonas_sp.AAC.1
MAPCDRPISAYRASTVRRLVMSRVCARGARPEGADPADPPVAGVHHADVRRRHQRRGGAQDCALRGGPPPGRANQPDARGAGILSRRTNHAQEARVCPHEGPTRRKKRGYIFTTDRSDAGNPATGLDTDTVELTVKTLSSHLVTREFEGLASDCRSN